MKNRRIEEYLQSSLRQGEKGSPGKIEETAAGCIEIMRRQGEYEEEERTGFWQFLSDVLRFEGPAIFGLQAGVLFVVCLQAGFMENVSHYIPVFTPLFALAVMPVLLRSQFYKMGEMEAATRASGAEIILAKLILAGAANLIGFTVLLGLVVRLQNSRENMGQMILYGLVPYLVCMSAILRLIRLRRKERIFAWAVVTAGSCVGWGLSANTLSWLYETSAAGIWIVLFVVFTAFFGKEICLIWEMKREGKPYGIID
ncbi:MAG: hypothetical protein K2K90_06470 [Lachnospiraceae bacterium]|nr:hypothetical protein [Lachnospiraceae bacterium]